MKKRVRIVRKLGSEKTICIGNGNNDISMFKASIFSIAVIGDEGCFAKLILASDVVVKNIEDAFALLINPQKIKATTRF